MSEERVQLRCHPATPADAVRSISALVSRSAAAQLRIRFRLEGDIARLRVPAAAAPAIGSELWRHTCFEAFIGLFGQAAYHELNFSPSGQWTIYAFRQYRSGAPLADQSMRPRIAVRRAPGWLELDAAVGLEALSESHRRAPLRVGLTAVIETSGGFSYWAIRHPSAKPDFHDPDGFALLLEPPGDQAR